MTTIKTSHLIREAADNCGDQLDIWRQYHRPRIWRGIAWGLVLGVAFWGALFALYTYATSGGAW